MTSLYEGLILTTIKPDERTETLDEDGKVIVTVSFTNASENVESGSEASFLKDVKKEGDKLTATYVSIKEAEEFANNNDNKDRVKLFCVHGCCGNPEQILEMLSPAKEVFDDKYKENKKNECLLIPVLWPTRGFSNLLTNFLPGYIADFEENAPDAGGILADLVNSIKNGSFGKVSLLCHSMGNHLVFNNAGLQNTEPRTQIDAPDVKFENIFMVAADVPNDIFSPNPRQTEFEFDFDEKEQKAENLTKMLVKGGKIYVLHRDDDRALQGSVFAKWFRLFLPRLGTTGAKNIRTEFNGTVLNYNTEPNFIEKAKDAGDAALDAGGDVVDFVDFVLEIDPSNHNYLFKSKIVDFYNFVHGKKEDQAQKQFDKQVREKFDLTGFTEDEGSN